MKVIINLTKKDLRTIKKDCARCGCGDCPSEHICTELFRFTDMPMPDEWTPGFMKGLNGKSGLIHGVRYAISVKER